MEMRAAVSGNERCSLPKPSNQVVFFADLAQVFEKARVAAEVRMAHLGRQGRQDEETAELHKRVKALEDFTDSWLKEKTSNHPTADWLKCISGCSTKKSILAEPVCKFIGIVDSFGKYYPEGDEWIPSFVNREPIPDQQGQKWVWVEGIERLATPSKLWKFAAMDPGAKRQKGKLSTGSSQLKTILFRIMILFMYSTNRYYDHYIGYKAWKKSELEKAGIKVRPTPSGRYCSVCEIEHKTKAGVYCPVCGEKLSKKDEPEGFIWEGHLDFMARRHTMKLFLSHWWLVYRKALNLPVRAPYPVEHMGHETIIDPWQMCDKAGDQEKTV